MRTITFSLVRDASKPRGDVVLSILGELPGIVKAARISPEGRSDLARRLCYAAIADDADINGLLAEMRKIPEIEDADIPEERYAL